MAFRVSDWPTVYSLVCETMYLYVPTIIAIARLSQLLAPHGFLDDTYDYVWDKNFPIRFVWRTTQSCEIGA